MTSIDLGIVILHYNNIEDTQDCVRSFEECLDTESYRIVIVDNCSPNGSGVVLQAAFANDSLVDVVLSMSNTGNAQGLNIGLEHLRKEYAPKFVVFSDNDILLLDDRLFEHLNQEHENSGFAVLGPMILKPDGRYDDNPIFHSFYSRSNAAYDLSYFKQRLRATKFHCDRLYLFWRAHNPFVRIHKKKVYETRKRQGTAYYRQENIVCHGCFLVLSSTYLSRFDGLDARTFMYAEEDILYAHLIHSGLKSVYLPSICVLHKGGSSVGATYRQDRKRKLFLFENYIKAIEAYLLLLDELRL